MPPKIWTLFSFLWLSLLLYLSFYKPSANPSPPFFLHQDKVGHFVFYGLLFFLLAQSFRLHLLWVHSKLYALLWALFLGILIEYLQGALTDYRVSDWKDVLANSSGVLLFYLGYSRIFKIT